MDLYIVMLGVVLFGAAQAFPGGAPISACHRMYPDHGFSVQSGSPPYALIAGADTYTPGRSVTVRFQGSTYFRGLLLQVRNEQNQVVGSLSHHPSSRSLRTRRCFHYRRRDTITHSSSSRKQRFIVTWVPPRHSVGVVQFVATVVKDADVFWMNIRSDPIRPNL